MSTVDPVAYDLKVGQLVECEWLDPMAGSDWKEIGDVTELERFLCMSVGFVHVLSPVGLILTACYGEDLEGDRSLLLRQYLPWCCITEVWILRDSE